MSSGTLLTPSTIFPSYTYSRVLPGSSRPPGPFTLTKTNLSPTGTAVGARRLSDLAQVRSVNAGQKAALRRADTSGDGLVTVAELEAFQRTDSAAARQLGSVFASRFAWDVAGTLSGAESVFERDASISIGAVEGTPTPAPNAERLIAELPKPLRSAAVKLLRAKNGLDYRPYISTRDVAAPRTDEERALAAWLNANPVMKPGPREVRVSSLAPREVPVSSGAAFGARVEMQTHVRAESGVVDGPVSHVYRSFGGRRVLESRVTQRQAEFFTAERQASTLRLDLKPGQRALVTTSDDAKVYTPGMPGLAISTGGPLLVEVFDARGAKVGDFMTYLPRPLSLTTEVPVGTIEGVRTGAVPVVDTDGVRLAPSALKVTERSHPA